MATDSNTKTTVQQDTDAFRAVCQAFATAVDGGDEKVIDAAGVAIQTTYAGIHSTRRGNVQSAVIGAFLPYLDAILTLLNNLPAAPSTRTAEKVSDDARTMIRAFVMGNLDNMLPSFDALHLLAGTTMSAVDRTAVEKFVARLRTDMATANVGSEKQQYDRSPAALLSIAPAGTALTGNLPNQGGTVKAKVLADGQVSYQGQKGTPSKMAGIAVGRNQNGWDFWRVNGVTLANVTA